MKFTGIRIAAVLFLIAFSAVSLYVPRHIEATEQKHKQALLDSVFGTRPVVLEYTSPDCSSCAAMRPVVAQLKKDYAGRIDFVEVSVTSDKFAALMAMYPPEYLPSFYLMFDQDTVYNHFEGEIQDDLFRNMLDDMMNAPANLLN